MSLIRIKKFAIYVKKKRFITDAEKIRDHCHFTGKYRGATHNICNMNYKISKNISFVFHNGSTYDYHFIIKELAKEFNGQFECLGENTEKYINFSVPINKKATEIDKEITKKLKNTIQIKIY